MKKHTHIFNRIKPILEASLIALIVIALIFFSTYLTHIKSIDSLEEEIKIGLETNTITAAATVNGDIHQLFNKETQRDDSLYITQITPLEYIRQKSKDIRYIYTNILKDDKVYFMLNPSPQNDNDEDGLPDLAPALMEEYKNPSPELIQALKLQKSITSNIYSDKWGVFISAYAPFYDSNDRFVGTLGMDLELNNFYKRLVPIRVAFEKAVIIIIFIGFVIGLLIWYSRKHIQILLMNNKINRQKIQELTNALKKEETNLINKKNKEL